MRALLQEKYRLVDSEKARELILVAQGNKDELRMLNGLQVGGDLYLSDTPITSLPTGLKVGGWFDLYNTKITSLPTDLKVGGDLYLAGTKITTLPPDLQVGGKIYKDF